jgi:nicotinate-nucleotide adenylyltransferase
MKIGILGGSFDPIHIGHITLAEYVREGAELDKIILLPAYESPFKIGMSGAGDRHRLNMNILKYPRMTLIRERSRIQLILCQNFSICILTTGSTL